MFALIMLFLSVVPLGLGITIYLYFGRSRFSFSILLFTIALSFWGVDLLLLYSKEYIEIGLLTLLFKLFRLGSLGVMTVYYYVLHSMSYEIDPFEKGINKIVYKYLHSKIVLYLHILLLAISYTINLSPMGISGMELTSANGQEFLSPTYGSLGFVIYIQLIISLFHVVIGVFFSFLIKNPNLRYFMIIFNSSVVVVYLMGMLNMTKYSFHLSGIFAVIFSCLFITISFAKYNLSIVQEYKYRLTYENRINNSDKTAVALIHELNNTIAVLKNIDYLPGRINNTDELTSELLRELSFAVDHQHKIAKRFATYQNNSKLEVGNADLKTIIQESVMLTRQLSKNENVEVNLLFHGKDFVAVCDSTRLKQVFINLIKNSIEATPTERENKRITIDLYDNKKELIIILQDSGKGISEDKWISIFEPFSSTKAAGRGIGLSLSKSIIENHGGTIQVLYSSSYGTSFEIRLNKNLSYVMAENKSRS